jgi:hypothetical protein
MGKTRREDPVMQIVRKVFAESGMTYQVLGEKMGHPPGTARQSVAQFLKCGDPQISTLRRFAAAVGVPLNRLLK